MPHDNLSKQYYIGQMSGTSLDGVDTVLIQTKDDQLQLITQHHASFDTQLKIQLLALCQGTDDELNLSSLLANRLSELYAIGVNSVLTQSNIQAQQVAAIGCHGQTVRHMPPDYTVQLINGAVLAERTDIDVVCDFRSRDMAAGGQGAPLVPAFHKSLFNLEQEDVFVVNIGGMANISYLHHQGDVCGHDTGPGNVLMDAWCQLHQDTPFDTDGQWASRGQVIDPLLNEFLQDPYFKMLPPKSTGRERFNMSWLQRFKIDEYATQDVMATLTQLTINTIATEIELLNDSGKVIICGGGALNRHLLAGIEKRLAGFEVGSSQDYGHDPQAIEAMAFAWLAKQCLDRKPSNIPGVTGAKGHRILGAIYPA